MLRAARDAPGRALGTRGAAHTAASEPPIHHSCVGGGLCCLGAVQHGMECLTDPTTARFGARCSRSCCRTCRIKHAGTTVKLTETGLTAPSLCTRPGVAGTRTDSFGGPSSKSKAAHHGN